MAYVGYRFVGPFVRLMGVVALWASCSVVAGTVGGASLDERFVREVMPVLEAFCLDCHSGADAQAEIDLAQFRDVETSRRRVRTWLRVREMVDTGQMPPPEANQPSVEERQRLQAWLRDFLREEAARRASDPGAIPLRRLNHAEYTYTIRDLTGVMTLSPAEEFPVDGAAGEGFTNTGLALSMSPMLFEKYIAAAEGIAAHAVLTPTGIRFSPSTSRRDWTNEVLGAIRELYGRFTDDGGGVAVNLQGIQFTTNQGGRLPLEKYLQALAQSEPALLAGEQTLEEVAAQAGLSARYLARLWQLVRDEVPASPLTVWLRDRWHAVPPEEKVALAEEITRWQRVLWRQNAVGHIVRHLGGTTGPAAWLEPLTPLVSEQEVRVRLPDVPSETITLYLAALDAGDGCQEEYVRWERPRIVVPHRPEIHLSELPTMAAEIAVQQKRFAETAAACLAAVADVQRTQGTWDVDELATRHRVPADVLRAWLTGLGFLSVPSPAGTYIRRRAERIEGYDFVRGWVGDQALSVLANASDQQVRIPGRMVPHSVAVHPTPSERAVVAWRSPVRARAQIMARVQHAHPECGNGTTWSVEWRRGWWRQPLAAGVTQRERTVENGPLVVSVFPGDVVALTIGPRDGNHACDLTTVELIVEVGEYRWSLWEDVAPDILAGNPHADRRGQADVWHFYSEPDNDLGWWTIPEGSLFQRWWNADDPQQKAELAKQIQELLQQAVDAPHRLAADQQWARQWLSVRGPLVSSLRPERTRVVAPPQHRPPVALPESLFVPPAASPHAQNDSTTLYLAGGRRVAISLPSELIAGGEFVATVRLDERSADTAAAQVYAGIEPPPSSDLLPSLPVLARPDTEGWKRWQQAFEQFQEIFPPALCYTQIVPVDEVITLNLFYREDERLQRLMLTAAEAEALERLWQELWFISQEPLQLAAAYEQLVEYATQDRPDKVAELRPLRPAIEARVQLFQEQQQRAAEQQLDALLRWAARAFRRPLSDTEITRLKNYYHQLRQEHTEHEEAVRLLIVRILTSPAFLYRLEEARKGAVVHPVSDFELATRLSYFLWASMPDDELWELACQGQLQDPQVLRSQMMRMLHDPKIRRLATEFAAQWLQVYDFDKHNEKSENAFPEFADLRGLMYEEFVEFFTNLFQSNGSVLDIVDADYTFVNEQLAAFYGIPGIEGPSWRRLENSGRWARGGILRQAAVLAKQAGASRTSPVLRGAWISEVLLGEKLPKPPKNVPPLAEETPPDLSERQLVERHSRDPACARCHARIDPLGFALENYDAIGRYRQRDMHGRPIDAKTTLVDGTVLDGVDALRKYISHVRRQEFIRQFNRKLLGYALGRPVQLSDELLLEDMERTLAAEDYRVWSAVEKIVMSPQFRQMRGLDFPDSDTEE